MKKRDPRPLEYAFTLDNLTFIGQGQRIIHRPAVFAKATNGIQNVRHILFNKLVHHVQLYVEQDGTEIEVVPITKTGFLENDTVIFSNKKGIINISPSEAFNRLYIKGEGVIVFRIHYDERLYTGGTHSYQICGIKIEEQLLPSTPTGLTTQCLLGGIGTAENCEPINIAFRAGLNWDIPFTPLLGLQSNGPVGYKIKRGDPRGNTALLNNDSFVRVQTNTTLFDEYLAQGIGRKDCSGNLIQKQPYYVDSADEKGTYKYHVSAVDIWQRESSYSDKASITFTPPLPPPPEDLVAHFIDISTYDATTDTVFDQLLSTKDKDWLRTNRQSAFVIRWRWSIEMQDRFPWAK